MDRALQERMARRRLAHALILTGRDRAGLAGTLAAALVCTGAEPPCGTCPACRKAARDIHPDVVRLDPEGEGLKAEDVRALRAGAWIRPNEAERKVYILCHSELLTPAGQNILLKLIEEGPAYAAFLFLTPNPELLLPTVRSRCETLRAAGEEEGAATEDGAALADHILRGGSEAEILPLLVSLEQRDRGELARLLEETAARLTAAAKDRPEALAALDRLAPIRAACEFNISAGHLAGWIASAL
jgi:DNA polymerase-3 subunit delta'